jgi:DNA polymerase-3 subunit delta
MAEAIAYLVKGDDAALVAQATRGLLDRLVGDRDPALVVEELGGSSAEDLDVGAVVDACTTPPFLVDRRVVVVRDASRLTAADAQRLLPAIRELMTSTIVVFAAGGGGTIPQALAKGITELGEVIDTAVGTGKDRQGWLAKQMKRAPVRLDAEAQASVGAHLGDDLGRLDGLLRSLASTYGEGSTLGLEEVRPYLGAAGSVPPWDLTDAIDESRTEVALQTLDRMTEAGGRAGPEIVAILARHFSQMLRLDGAQVSSGEEAAALLGVRSAYVGKKAMAQSSRLGSEGIVQAMKLIAQADIDVKGATALDSSLVLEILVARLSRLVRPRAAGRRR